MGFKLFYDEDVHRMTARRRTPDQPAGAVRELPVTVARPGGLDAADPLASYRDRFVGAETPLVYFDGNSLGRPLKVTGPRLAAFVEQEWGGRLIRGWDERWFDLPRTIGDELGRGRASAPAPGTVAIGDSTTVLLYKLMRAAVAARPGPHRDRDRPRQLPDRPLRRRRRRRRVRADAALDRRRHQRRA